MTTKNKVFYDIPNHDGCKNCGTYSFVCKYCNEREYYRHIDDKIKMKENLKSLRKKRVIFLLEILE